MDQTRDTPDRGLFLHETVDIIGQGQYEYMEHVQREPVQRMPSMMKLQGTFFVCAAGGGRWPQVINLWDLQGGWDAWARNVDRLNLKRRKAFYGDWWDKAATWRSGGFDRLCGAAPGSPTTADIAARGVRGTLFVHELLTVRPGAVLDFLAAVAELRVPLMRDYGHEPVALLEVLSNQHEAVVVWATSIRSQVGYRRARDRAHGLLTTAPEPGETDDRIIEWDRHSAALVRGGDTHIMTPLPGTVYGPPDWEDASLDDWLEPE
jgi:hypothetical protein